ncbi:MAG TPA: biotin/lipoyl-containing protein [Candidatus Tumulicola sp.]
MDDADDSEMATLRALLALMHEHDLDRLKVKSGEAVYEIVRREAGQAPAFAAPAAESSGPGADASAEPSPVAGPHTKKVIAPLTGVFYRSSSPDTEAFVSVGDRAENGDVLCILEAMKLFNEIQSDYAGTIVRIVPENGELVSQGAELFWIEP